jgi:peptidoglycan/LPS O-acetylase OafA/YrhL
MSFPNNNQYIPYLDGCRGIAISIVVLSHAGLGSIIPGKFGVTLFFFISGFLITKLLLLEYERKGTIKLKEFYLRRFFRLYPALLTMVATSLLVSHYIPCTLSYKDVLSAIFYFTNYYIGWIREPVPDCNRLLDIVWSLSVEEHFYFVFPFLSLAFLKSNHQKAYRHFAFFLLALCVVALCLRIALLINHYDNPPYVNGRVYFSTHTRMDSILWGCLAAVLLFYRPSNTYRKMLAQKKYLWAGLLLLFLSVAIRYQPFRETLLFSFQGIGLFLIIPALGYQKSARIMAFLENKTLVFIGRVSYSLYLFHWVASKFANSRSQEHSVEWQVIFWSMTIALTLFSFYAIEKPFIQLRRRFGSHTTV